MPEPVPCAPHNYTGTAKITLLFHEINIYMKSGLISASSPLKRNRIMSELCGLTRGSGWNSQPLLFQQHPPFCSSLWWPLTREVLAQEPPGHLWEQPRHPRRGQGTPKLLDTPFPGLFGNPGRCCSKL